MLSPDLDAILYALEQANTKDDVARLIKQHGYESVAGQWDNLTPCQRGALALARNFEGVILHELNDSGPGSANPI